MVILLTRPFVFKKIVWGTVAQASPLCMPGKISTIELHTQPNQII